VRYAGDRKVFGDQPIGAYQGVQFPLAEARIQLECARLMNYKAASLYDSGQPYGSEANMAKWTAGRAAGRYLVATSVGTASFGAITAVMYTGLDPRLLRAASLSVLAHLEELTERGEAGVTGPPGLTAKFSVLD